MNIMKPMGKKIISWMIGTMAVVLLLSVQAYVYAGEVGVTDTEILLGTVADTTGPLANNGTQVNLGARTYFADVNEHGGIHGRKIKLINETDDYQTGKHIAALRKLLFVDKVFGFLNNVGSSSTLAAAPILQKEKVFLVGPQAPQPSLYTPPQRYIFGFYPDYVICGKVMLEHAVNYFKGKKSFKVAMFYQDDDVGRSSISGMKQQIARHPDMHIDVVSLAGYKRGDVDFNSQVEKIKASAPDIVLIVAIQGPAAAFLKEADKLNWKPKFVVSQAAPGPLVVELAGNKASEGLSYHNIFYNQTMTDESGVQEYTRMLKKYYPEEKPETFGICGYSVAKIVVEGLKRAGKDLTREKFVDALETLKDFETPSGIRVTYSPKFRVGCANAAFFSIVRNGKLIKETDWVIAK